MKTALTRKKLTLLTLVAALGVAVYLNWEYARTGDEDYGLAAAAQPDSAQQQVMADLNQDAQGVQLDPLSPTPAPGGDKNYGEAQLVSLSTASSSSEYFEQARLTRSKTRDAALDTLQKSLKSAKLTDEEKKELTGQLSGIINSIAIEGEIETLIKAKGFVDCVAFIDGTKANITVQTKSEGLTKGEVAQIRDIVIAKTDITAQNITIVEVK